jgi:hypothetical protein
MKRFGKHAAAFRRICLVLVTLAALATGCRKESAPPQGTALIGLSAHFIVNDQPIDDPGNVAYPRSHLKIQGQVYKDGVPVTKGAVNITVVSTTYKFNQSMFVELDDRGNFESPDDAFTSIHPGSAVTIKAELTFSGGYTSRTIELDSESPAKKWGVVVGILVILLVLTIIFLYAFTGQTGRVKNRWAIQFSYVVIVLFLAVPIVAPVLLLRLFPSAVDGMIGYPAGLVVTRIGEPPHANAQWAVNIGGYSHVCVDLCLDPGTLAQQAAEAKAKADARAKADEQAAAKSTSTPPSGPSLNSPPKPNDQKTPRTPPNAPSPGNPGSGISAPGAGKNQAPTPMRQAAASQTTTAPAANTAPAITPLASTNQPAGATNTADAYYSNGSIASRDNSAQARPNPTDDLLHPDRLDPDIVKVEGGLVIPLYVIVLSVIGGAINMTRKVPGFQKEGESSAATKSHKIPDRSPNGIDGEAEEEQAVGVKAADDKSAVAATVKAVDDNAAAAQAAAAPKLSLEEQATQIDHDLDGIIPAQIQRNIDTAITVPKMQALVSQMQNLFATNTNPTLRGYRNFDEWYVSRPRMREILGGSWRVELLNQYMYLISAPFLAIVTYYILDLLGLSKPGVVVVLSFSVGLISEKIVTWILGIAAGYMQTPKN